MIEFVTFEEVCEMHDLALQRYGHGLLGFLDEAAVRSAVLMPQSGLSGEYFFDFPAGMAAAYLYYLTQQQGFLQGNKRSAVSACAAFLGKNGYLLRATDWDLYQVTCRVTGEDSGLPSHTAIELLQEWIAERLDTMP